MKRARLVLMAITMFTFLGTSLAFTSLKRTSDLTLYVTDENDLSAWVTFEHAKITTQGNGTPYWYTTKQFDPALVYAWITYDIE